MRVTNVSGSVGVVGFVDVRAISAGPLGAASIGGAT